MWQIDSSIKAVIRPISNYEEKSLQIISIYFQMCFLALHVGEKIKGPPLLIPMGSFSNTIFPVVPHPQRKIEEKEILLISSHMVSTTKQGPINKGLFGNIFKNIYKKIILKVSSLNLKSNFYLKIQI